jgi:HK97 family phage major capsid protein
MPFGKLSLPRISTAAAATYGAENANVGKTQQGTDKVDLVFKKLAALVPISNDLIRYSIANTNSVILNDVVRAMAAKEDITFLRSTGSGNSPTGISSLVD